MLLQPEECVWRGRCTQRLLITAGVVEKQSTVAKLMSVNESSGGAGGYGVCLGLHLYLHRQHQ